MKVWMALTLGENIHHSSCVLGFYGTCYQRGLLLPHFASPVANPFGPHTATTTLLCVIMFGTNSTAEHFRCIKQAADKPLALLKSSRINGAEVVAIREVTINIDHCPTVVRRVYIKTKGSGALADIGWVLNEGITCCLCCHKNFTKLARRHHCRACGSLICAECSRMAKLAGFPTLGLQRVCMSCVTPHAVEPLAMLADQANAGEKVYDAAPKAPEQKEKDMLSLAKKAALSAPQSMTIEPLPGFVIKVRRTTQDESKIFINVFHTKFADKYKLLTHIPETENENEKEAEQMQQENSPPNVIPESADLRSLSKCKDEHKHSAPVPTKSGFRLFNFSNTSHVPTHVLSDYTTYTLSKGEGSPDSALTSASTLEETEQSNAVRMLPLVYVGPASSTVDKEGHVSLLYSVLVSSAYFERKTVQAQEVQITHPTSINKIIQIVNNAHKESLCEYAFSLPRIKRGFMTAHNEELTTEIYTRSDYSVAFVPDEKITTIRYIRFGSMSSEVSAQSFVSTAEHYQTKNQGSTTRRNSPPPEGRDHTVPVNHCSVPNNRPVFVHSHSQMMANDWYSARPMTTRPHSAPDLTALNAKLAAGSLVGNGGNKKSFITALDVEPEMLHFRHLTALTVGQSEEIKARSCTWPKLLVGYQIIMPYTKEDVKYKLSIVDQSRVYVIIDTRKNASFQTEYRITNSVNIANSVWTRLQRSTIKTGAEFRIVYKVANKLLN